LLVAAGGNGDDAGTILTSPDGTAWTDQKSGSSRPLFAVAWANHRLFALGDYMILSSADGEAWQDQLVDRTLDFSLAWTGKQYVVVGYPGVILTSPDGLTWTRRLSQTEFALNSVAWNGNLLVAVGAHGTVLTATEDPPAAAAAPFSPPRGPSLRIRDGALHAAFPEAWLPVSRLSILSPSGKRLRSVPGTGRNGEATIPLGALPRGTYILEAEGPRRKAAAAFRLPE
jgi:hypothetical protein